MDNIDSSWLATYNSPDVGSHIIDNINPSILTQNDDFNLSHQTNTALGSSSYMSVSNGLQSRQIEGNIPGSSTVFERSGAFPTNRKRGRSPSPPIKEDEDQGRLRQKNREAARRYRDKRRRNDAELAFELHQLRTENDFWQTQVHYLNAQLAHLRQLLRQHEQIEQAHGAAPIPDGYGHGLMNQAANYGQPIPGYIVQPYASQYAIQTPGPGFEMNFGGNEYH